MDSPIGLNVVSCVNDRHSSRLPARRVHTENQSGTYEQYRVVRSPRAATEVRTSFSDYLYRSPGSRNLLYFPCRKETDPPAVRGPKWILGILGSGEFARVYLLHGSHPEHGFSSGSF